MTAEAQFKECVDVTPGVTPSTTNLFVAKRNLLLSYAQYDMDQANQYADSITDFVDEGNLSNDFGCILGNVKFFSGQMDEAKYVFKLALRKEPH